MSRINEYIEASSFANDDYLIIDGDTNGTRKFKAQDVTKNHATKTEVEAALATKAEIDGNYESMTVGNAGQLVSNVVEEDQVPYQFRTSGGSIDIGDRETDMLVGGTICWNQLIPDYNPVVLVKSTKRTDGILLDSRTKILNGHKYCFTAKKYNIANLTTNAYIDLYTRINGTNTSIKAMRIIDDGVMFIAPADAVGNGTNNTNGSLWVHAYILTTEPNDDATVSFDDIQLFDLTKMFGSTIADYIYSLEQANAGAGVAWFKKLFPKDYYAYNAGELMSVSGVSAHEMVGFNAWDEEWEAVLYNASGVKGPSTVYIGSKNYIHVLPNTDYCITCKTGGAGISFFVCEYDIDKTFISRSNYAVSTTINGKIHTTSPNTYYMTFCVGGTTTPVQTYNNDICINLSWDGERDGEYEEYVKRSYPLDPTLTLRGIPQLDANNQLYYDGDTYESDGTVTRKYGIVDLGALNWVRIANPASALSGTYLFYSRRDANYVIADNSEKRITPLYENVISFTNLNKDKTIGYIYTNQIAIRDDSYTDADTFKAAMSGVMLVYELAEPTTEEADPYQNPQIVDDFGTEEYVTTSLVPVGHYTQYQPNLRAKLEMAPDSPDDDGDYVVRHANGENKYVPLAIPGGLPTAPSEDGNYVLKCAISSGTATYSWVAET